MCNYFMCNYLMCNAMHENILVIIKKNNVKELNRQVKTSLFLILLSYL